MENKVKSFNEIEKIECPHCGEICGFDNVDYGEELITYWGEESVEMDCPNCGKKFFIYECVHRDWDVAKDYNDF